MELTRFKMDAKISTFLVIFLLNLGFSCETEPEIIGVVIDNPDEVAIYENKTDSDWSQVVTDLAIALERIDREGARVEGDEAEETSGKSRIIKRQVIKIPSSVTKVKVIAPNPIPQTRPKRMPPVTRIYPYHQRRKPMKKPNKGLEIEDDYEEGKHHRIREAEPQRGKYSKKSKTIVKEVTPEEFFEEDEHQYVTATHVDSHPKHTRKNSSKKPQRHLHYGSLEETNEEPYHQRRARRPPAEDYSYETNRERKTESEYSRPVRNHGEKRPISSNSEYTYEREKRPLSTYPNSEYSHEREKKPIPSYSNSDYSYEREKRPASTYSSGSISGYTHEREKRPISSYNGLEYAHDRDYEEYSASNTHMKQVPAPNLTGLNVIDPPDLMKEARFSSTRKAKENPVSDYVQQKAAPTSKEIISNFPQQYTSHNPQVVTNFGLDETQTKAKSYSPPKLDHSNLDTFVGTSTRFSAAASEHHSKTVSPGGTGMQVVQPPQFGSGSVTIQGTGQNFVDTSRGNMRATIRDILQQDCPDFEILGYCSSPPRYPTIQIAEMANKCSDLNDIMTSPVPAEPEDDLTSFSRKSDDDLDIEFEESDNSTNSDTSQNWPSWSRSGGETDTACTSEYTIIEPGYAREVSSGRWFVIVQNADSSLQKVTTDTCLNPGKPCAGLAGMKCTRSRGFQNGIKSSRCIQRYTHQRLISWDPEAPNKCPSIRIFRFPTACICHLRTL